MTWRDVAFRPNVVLGAACFVAMNCMQNAHHIILANLRRNPQQNKAAEKFYYLPQGLWFRYVDTPHYFCEILIYFSLLLVCEFRHLLLYCRRNPIGGK